MSITFSIRIIGLILLFQLSSFSARSQLVTREDFVSVIPSIQSEDFETAFEKTKSILDKTEEDTSDLHAIVSYMNILSGAGLVSNGTMLTDKFGKYVQRFVGKKILLAAHPCIDSTAHSYNAVQILQEQGRWKGFITSTNKSATTILAFEYLKFSNPEMAPGFIGKNIRCGGVLRSIVVAKSKLVICRLYIEDAFIREYQ